MGESLFRQFRGDKIRIRGTMLEELVQQPIEEYITELGMQIRVKQNRSSVTIAVVLDEDELLFLAGDHANTFDADVDEQPVRDMTQNDDNNFQADECDAFDSDIDGTYCSDHLHGQPFLRWGNTSISWSLACIGNGYSRKRQKQGQKQQNQTQNGKDRKRQSRSKPKSQKSKPEVNKSQPRESQSQPRQSRG
uniref:Retrovirus-related Pol polyprotein from transposon TNT 1-94 n=1 Tax=Tanacetum cinerariifolium TaxID=118510 RepID=A0A699GXH5_TANCI|nr:retrovirus-related Pol polyprotein from transposon TNT 1-94 [Tanacetum cinerariifolium]